MARGRLDSKLLDKIRKSLGKERRAVNVRVSQLASKLGISSEAALVLEAKKLGIGTAVYQRKLDPAKQVEIRESLPILFEEKAVKEKITSKKKKKVKS